MHQLFDHFQFSIDSECTCREFMFVLDEKPIERRTNVIVQRRLIRKGRFGRVRMEESIFDQRVKEALTNLIAALTKLKNDT